MDINQDIKAANSSDNNGNNRFFLTPWRKKDWYILGGLIIAAALAFFLGLGSFGILDPSDGAYAEGAREMIEKNDFLSPQLNYEPFFDKPILIYWLIAGSYKIFGVHEWSARLPSAISGIILVSSLYVICRIFLRRRAAWLAAVALLSNVLFVVVGHLATTDMLLTLFVTVATLLLFRAATIKSDYIVWFSYLLLGLGLLLKGPIAAGLPFLAFAGYWAYLATQGQWHQIRHHIANLKLGWGILIMLVVATPWYVLEIMHTHGSFFFEFFVKHNVDRALGMLNHQGPFWFYIPWFFIGFLPWSLFSFPIGKLIARSLSKTRLGSRYQLSSFVSCWFIWTLLFFSAAQAKLPTYILPAAPAFAILTGLTLENLLRLNVGFPNRKKALFAFVFVAIVSIILLVPLGLHYFDEKFDLPFRNLLSDVQQNKGSLAILMRESPAANFYLSKHVWVVTFQNDLTRFVTQAPPPHYFAVTRELATQVSVRFKSVREIGKHGRWVVYLVSP